MERKEANFMPKNKIFGQAGGGMLVSDGDKKLHLISCEATCVHEEVAKRIPNVRFTLAVRKR